AAGKPWWLAFVANKTAPGVYTGDIFATTGPAFNAVPFDPATVVETTNGVVTLTFTDGNNATFAYTVNGVTQTKQIARQVFAAPGTVCSSVQPGQSATPVGVPDGNAGSATIGAAGGSVSTPDGKLVVTIPAGALSASTLISIQPLTNTAHGKIGPAFRLTPEGQTFLKPVTFAFTYADQDLLGTAVEVLGAAFQTAGGYWQWAGDATFDALAKIVRVESSHFSDWSLVKGLQIRPPSKSVRVNGSVALHVVTCFSS